MPLFVAALARAPVDPTHDLIRFLVVTGWRVSEARLIDWSQVNLRELAVAAHRQRDQETSELLSPDAALLIERQPGRAGAVFSNRAGSRCPTRICARRSVAVLDAAESRPRRLPRTACSEPSRRTR